MQKKLIALAVAGLLSAPAFAQSNVVLYGTLDYGLASFGSSAVRNHDHGFGDEGKYKSRNGVESGISKFNRIGFKGTEDLGNGLKAVFVLEQGLLGDRQGDNGVFNGVNRQSYAGLQGGFGTVAFGHQYTPQHLFSAAVDPFGKNGIGGLNNSLVQDTRLSNLAAYISPSWGGFSFIAGYTFGGTANENVENDGDARVWAIAPSFTWNNLFVGANYHAVKANSAHGSNTKLWNVLEAYASYDFGFVKLGGLVGRRTAPDVVGDRDGKIMQYMLGATFKITDNDKVMASYTYAKENSIAGSDRTKLSQWAIGYEHALSKRTALYAIGAFQSWNDDADAAFWRGNAGAGGVGNASLGYDNAALYKRGLGVGIRHDF
ncbi:MAG: porin [Azoarcus sp.]|jgi:predicted porin|nr:porin [Azoarcus sp.]